MTIFDIFVLAVTAIFVLIVCFTYFIDWSVGKAFENKYNNQKDLKERREKLQW